MLHRTPTRHSVRISETKEKCSKHSRQREDYPESENNLSYSSVMPQHQPIGLIVGWISWWKNPKCEEREMTSRSQWYLYKIDMARAFMSHDITMRLVLVYQQLEISAKLFYYLMRGKGAVFLSSSVHKLTWPCSLPLVPLWSLGFTIPRPFRRDVDW